MLLLTATISFAFLDVYVNMQGIAEVSSPEFYIGSDAEETLLINEKSLDCASFGITDTYRTFKTKELGGVNFNYIPQAKFFVRAKVTGTTTPQDLILNFGYFDTGGSLHPVCSETVSLTDSISNHITEFKQCSEIPNNVKQFYYEFQKDDDCLGCDYTISKCAGEFYTKIELKK